MLRLKLILIFFLSLFAGAVNAQTITGNVTHCSAGQANGAIDLTVNLGSQNLTYYKWARLNNGVPVLVEQGSSVNNVDVNNLQDGLYLFYCQNGSTLIDYHYFLVGEEGKITTVNFKFNNNNDRKKYNEDALLKYVKSTQNGNLTGGNKTGITAATNTSYDSKALIKYKVDFDSQLEFLSANQTLEPKGGHYRKTATDNSGWLSLVTSNWDENTVTWNSAPNTISTHQVSIASTPANTYTMRYDTLSILNFVKYWQTNPNHGFELALQSYNQSNSAILDYKSSDYGNPNLILSYTIKTSDTLYWTGAYSLNWSDSMNWSNNSGGIDAGTIPNYNSILVFDENGNKNCYSDIDRAVDKVIIKSGYTSNLSFGSSKLNTNEILMQNE